LDRLGVLKADKAAAGIRGLSEADFLAQYGCDRFTATVMANRFHYVVSHMCSEFRTRAFSPILRDAADMCGMFSGPPSLGYPMAAVSETVPIFYGSIPDGVRIVVEEYGVEELVPGDVLIVNDYYRVGTHLNDTCCIRPIFFGGELAGVVTIRAHISDMGGAVKGGFDSTKRSMYEDGLRLPPMLLYSAGKPVKSTFKLLLANTRHSDLLTPDLYAECHALELAEQLIVDTIGKYGMPAYLGALRYVCDSSAESMETALKSLPDGVYQGEQWLDGDGLEDSPEYVLKVRIKKAGGRAEFDFRGSSPSTRTAVNSAWPDAKSAVTMALKMLIDPKTPVTSGTLRPVDIVLPPDSPINAAPPAACQYYNIVNVTGVHAIFAALNPVLGPDAVAPGTVSTILGQYGRLPDGSEWPQPATLCGVGPWGATKHGDGDSGQQSWFSNLRLDGGAEAAERSFPVLNLTSEYVADTAGAGTNRGGAATAFDFMVLPATQHRFEQFRCKRPLVDGGVYGGSAGPTTAAWLWHGEISNHGTTPPFIPASLSYSGYRDAVRLGGMFDPITNSMNQDGEYVPPGRRVPSSAGAVARVITYGGGGWGDPLERDPERVKVDVRDGYVTTEGAAREYGVVIAGDAERYPERLAVDVKATNALRLELRTRHGVTRKDARADASSRNVPEASIVPVKESVEGACEACGAEQLARYPLLGPEGWVMVVKCQMCLNSNSRAPWHRLGWIRLPDDEL
jgi:N-methylhydantoinase B